MTEQINKKSFSPPSYGTRNYCIPLINTSGNKITLHKKQKTFSCAGSVHEAASILACHQLCISKLDKNLLVSESPRRLVSIH